MNAGNLQSAAGRLQEALETLQAAWMKTSEQWQDERSRAIEDDFLRPLAEEVGIAVPAIQQMAQGLSGAVRACDDRTGSSRG